MNKKSTIYKITAITIIIFGIFFVAFYYREFLELNRIKCNFKNGSYQEGKCLISNLESLKKYLSDVEIIIPNKQIDENKKNKIKLLSDKIIEVDNIRMTVVPFVITQDGVDNYYLGLFYSTRSLENYFEGVKHLDSYFLGENINLGEVKTERGLYNDFLTQEYFESGERKEVRLRVGECLTKFYIDKDCKEIGEVIEKTRGDGQKYTVCIMGKNRMCELESYKKGNCPLEGFDVSGLSEEKAYCLLTGNNPWTDTCNIMGKNIKCDFDDYFNGKCK